MNSPMQEKKAIYKHLKYLAGIINPNRFWDDMTHPLCPERDALIPVYFEYLAYEKWFKERVTA